MKKITRRSVALGIVASTSLAACGNGIGSGGAATIDARVNSTLDEMYRAYPGTRDLSNRAAGILVMPLITEVGLGLGGSYGRPAV